MHWTPYRVHLSVRQPPYELLTSETNDNEKKSWNTNKRKFEVIRNLGFRIWHSSIYSPAAKCNGVDLRPAVSLAFTVCELINFFTLTISPVLHASNNSRNGSLAMTASKLTANNARLRLDISASAQYFPVSVAKKKNYYYSLLLSLSLPHTASARFRCVRERFGSTIDDEDLNYIGCSTSVADALSHIHIHWHICQHLNHENGYKLLINRRSGWLHWFFISIAIGGCRQHCRNANDVPVCRCCCCHNEFQYYFFCSTLFMVSISWHNIDGLRKNIRIHTHSDHTHSQYNPILNNNEKILFFV